MTTSDFSILKLQNVIIILLCLLFFSCENRKVQRFSGEAFGTTYSVSYVGNDSKKMKSQVDSLLNDLSQTFSIFDSNSLISNFNDGKKVKLNPDFIKVFRLSKQVSAETMGAFDCTIQPLVELWGFGKEGVKHVVGDDTLREVKAHTGFQLVDLQNDKIIKKDSSVQLNFNAIAKGYAVDKVADFLVANGFKNCLVEIGGEVSARGEKNGKPWKVGIQTPCKDAYDKAESFKTIELSDNKSVATSGNYRNYFEENGERFTHILDPRTGTPERTNLLSVTVLAPDCATADAFATAFMVLGYDKSSGIVKKNPQIEAWFILSKNDEWELVYVK